MCRRSQRKRPIADIGDTGAHSERLSDALTGAPGPTPEGVRGRDEAGDAAPAGRLMCVSTS
jgi:hypothetical protein